jgi:hypothetical protein
MSIMHPNVVATRRCMACGYAPLTWDPGGTISYDMLGMTEDLYFCPECYWWTQDWVNYPKP